MHNSVFKRMDRSGDPALPPDKVFAGESVHRHDWCMSEQSPELNTLTHALADYGDQPDGCRFLIDHADRHLIGDNA